MKTIVTGGCGFIGSHLCEHLLSKGNEVICIDNLITGDTANIEDIYNNRGFTFIKQDVTYHNVEKVLLEKIDLKNVNEIYYLASIASPTKYLKMPLETIDVNTVGLKNFLEIALKYKIRLLYTSTSEVYGDPVKNPQAEYYNGNVCPHGDRAVYDESKRLGETLVSTYHRRYGLNTKIVRIFNCYGPKMAINDGRVIPTFINQALSNVPITVFGDGNQSRSFCYIEDMIRGLCLMMNRSYYLPVNIGNPYCYFHVSEIAEMIKRLTNSKSPIINTGVISQFEPKIRQPDITLAKNLLSWNPTIGIESGLKKTIQFYGGIDGVDCNSLK